MITCITNHTGSNPCTVPGEHLVSCTRDDCGGCFPRPADIGHVCQRCYDRIDHAIPVADRLRVQLTGVERALTPEATNAVAGPRVPLTAIQLDLDAINRAQGDHQDVTAWVQTEEGAADAVQFSVLVRAADKAHPTHEKERKLNRLRCPNCKMQTATWQPPDWPGDTVDITCINCAWKATNPDAHNIVATIETHGGLDDSQLLQLAYRAQKKADRAKGAA